MWRQEQKGSKSTISRQHRCLSTASVLKPQRYILGSWRGSYTADKLHNKRWLNGAVIAVWKVQTAWYSQQLHSVTEEIKSGWYESTIGVLSELAAQLYPSARWSCGAGTNICWEFLCERHLPRLCRPLTCNVTIRTWHGWWRSQQLVIRRCASWK